ncbi:MAG TPA: AAA family ATPase [Polyangium sp.]|jgi:predicted ATPase|nr:AAA family ATPase [Polyangium sp.]
MIHEVTISGLRGVDEGRITDLSPLVVLVGSNGSGKSTVLDALLIGTGDAPGDEVGRSVQRRPDLWNGARWLIPRHRETGSTIEVIRRRGGGEERRTTRLRFQDTIDTDLAHDLMEQRPGVPASGSIMVDVDCPGASHAALAGFLADNSYQCKYSEQQIPAWDTKLIDIPHGSNQPLDALFITATERGRLEQAVKILQSLYGDRIRDITVLTDKAAPVIYVVTDRGNIPIMALGDGIACLVRIVLELAIAPHGLVLLEEPEIHQSPRMIMSLAEIIWAAVDRGVQVVASTHSLAFINALLKYAPAWARGDLNILGLSLHKGLLTSQRLSTYDVEALRQELEAALG